MSVVVKVHMQVSFSNEDTVGPYWEGWQILASVLPEGTLNMVTWSLSMHVSIRTLHGHYHLISKKIKQYILSIICWSYMSTILLVKQNLRSFHQRDEEKLATTMVR